MLGADSLVNIYFETYRFEDKFPGNDNKVGEP